MITEVIIMARKKTAAQNAVSDLARAIRQCVDSGKVEFGAARGVKVALSGHAKLMIIASNCPDVLSQDVRHYCKLSGIPVIPYDGTSLELGAVAGRPHSVSVLAVHDAGNSGIMEFAKQ